MNLKFIGDDAAHRLMPPSKSQLRLSIDLLEALLTHLYEAKYDLEKKANAFTSAEFRKNKVDTWDDPTTNLETVT
jgi:hypothetical protein